MICGLLACIADIYVFKLGKEWFGEKIAFNCFLVNLVSWFNFFCITRSLSNSLETILTLPALFFLFKSLRASEEGKSSEDRRKGLLLAALSCLVRPTALALWIFFGAYLMFKQASKGKRRVLVFSSETLLVGFAQNFLSLFLFLTFSLFVRVVCVGFQVLVDRLGYGFWTFTLFNFFQFNFLSGQSDFYGRNDWHWYFTNGIPTVLFTHSLLLFGGLVLCSRRVLNEKKNLVAFLLDERMALFLGMVWMVFVYSFAGHKEFRFILTLVPVASIYCGLFTENSLSSQTNEDRSRKMRLRHYIVLILLLSNLLPLLFFSTAHQRGTLDLMEKVRTDSSVSSILFLMPCHSTPFYSHIHKNIHMRFLDCSPPLHKNTSHSVESDLFFEDPQNFTHKIFLDYKTQNKPFPTHVALFRPVEEFVKEVLFQLGFRPVSLFYHTLFPVDSRQGDVLLYQRMYNKMES